MFTLCAIKETFGRRQIPNGECALSIYHAFNRSMKACGDGGIKFISLASARDISCDGYAQSNILKPIHKGVQRQAFKFILNSRKPYLVTESAIFRSSGKESHARDWKRIGWYDFRWKQALFGSKNSPPDRWKKFEKKTKIKFKDWHSPGDQIIIMGQKENDSSLIELYKEHNSFWDWVILIITKIRSYSDRPILVRFHPKSSDRSKARKKLKKFKNISFSKKVDNKARFAQGKALGLYHDLKNAYCVVTYSSLSAIESICEGIPTYALGNASMIWPVALKDLSMIENLPYNTDITQWKNDIAYTQWTMKECESGEAWSHLKNVINNIK